MPVERFNFCLKQCITSCDMFHRHQLSFTTSIGTDFVDIIPTMSLAVLLIHPRLLQTNYWDITLQAIIVEPLQDLGTRSFLRMRVKLAWVNSVRCSRSGPIYVRSYLYCWFVNNKDRPHFKTVALGWWKTKHRHNSIWNDREADKKYIFCVAYSYFFKQERNISATFHVRSNCFNQTFNHNHRFYLLNICKILVRVFSDVLVANDFVTWASCIFCA